MKTIIAAAFIAATITTASAGFVASFSKGEIRVNQNAGSVTIPIKVTGSGDSMMGGLGTFEVEASEGTAKEGTDFESFWEGVLISEAGLYRVEIPLNRVPRRESNRAFHVRLSSFSGVRAGGRSAMKIVLVGADAPKEEKTARPKIKTTVKKLSRNRWRVTTVAKDKDGKQRRQVFVIDPKRIKGTKVFKTP